MFPSYTSAMFPVTCQPCSLYLHVNHVPYTYMSTMFPILTCQPCMFPCSLLTRQPCSLYLHVNHVPLFPSYTSTMFLIHLHVNHVPYTYMSTMIPILIHVNHVPFLHIMQLCFSSLYQVKVVNGRKTHEKRSSRESGTLNMQKRVHACV